MFRYAKEGWKAAIRQPFLLIALFVYRFAWGVALYRLAQTTVLPLMHRYPDPGSSAEQVRLFLAEAQFRILKTDLIQPYLWLLLGLLLARMMFTPLLNAAVFYSLAHTQFNTGYRFFKGMRQLGVSFTLYYFLQMLLTLGPLYFVLPFVKEIWNSHSSLDSLLPALLRVFAVCIVYGFLVRLFFLHIQFGRTQGLPFLRSAGTAVRAFLPILATALVILATALSAAAAAYSSSFIWAGFWALVLYQGYGILRTFFSLWGITAQHRIFLAKLG
jgi:hypothetical protein